MAIWRNLLGGMVLWAAHFFAVYAIASVWPGTRIAVFLTLLATVLALAFAAWLFVRTFDARVAGDALQRWSVGLGLCGLALAGAAIVYQGLPAAFT